MRIHHIAIYCRDLELTKDFFIHYFGAQSGSPYHNPRTGLRTCFLIFNEGSTRIELMTHPDTVDADPTARCVGYTHLSIAVGSREIVNSLTGRLAADGYTVVSQPSITGDGYYESCILGPENMEIEITV